MGHSWLAALPESPDDKAWVQSVPGWLFLWNPLPFVGSDRGRCTWCRICAPNLASNSGLSTPPPPLLQAFDDWVPLEVVRDLVQHLFASSSKLLADICPPDELNWAQL